MQVKHDYDRVSNRLCREDVLAKSQGTPVYIDELYTYDGMHQLTAQQRGELNVAHDGLVANSKTFAEQWTLDPTGNWSEFKQDTDGDGDWDLDQDRDHTVANEVLEIDDATTHVAHDRAGNMTRIPKPSDWSSHYHLAYDAWNRLVCVYDSDGETPISAYYYDGLGRRVIKDLYDEGSLTSRRHYYYSDTWQVLEERLETSDGSGGFDTAIVDRQYVWGLRYVDDLLSRDRNTDGTSTGDYGKTGSGLDERLMVLQDANYNVCAIANTTGVCLERYNYTAYGEPSCLTPAFADRASTDYDWDILYTGRQYDAETGLYQYRRRYYHPQLGRFISRDPIGYRGRTNLYKYIVDDHLDRQNDVIDITNLPEVSDDEVIDIMDLPPVKPSQQQRWGSMYICVRPIKDRPIGGHAYILLNCGSGLQVYRGGPSNGNNRNGCDCANQLVADTYPYQVAPNPNDTPPDIPKPGEDRNKIKCYRYSVNISNGDCEKIHKCFTDTINLINNCCIGYAAVPGPISSKCNSNCVVSWLAGRCLSSPPIWLPGGKILPGWPRTLPDCISNPHKPNPCPTACSGSSASSGSSPTT